MTVLSLPIRTTQSFSPEPPLPYNITLLLSKYLIYSDESENIKNEVFFYLTKDEQYFEGITSEYFAKLKKEKEKKDNNRNNKFVEVLQETQDIFKRLAKIGENNNFEDKKKQINHKISKSRKHLFQNINSILKEINSKLCGITKIKVSYTTSSRLVVGLGSASVLETSIKLHHIYGVPYIPSSAIKGVLRAYKLWELSEWHAELYRVFELAISKVYEKCASPDKFAEKLRNINERELKSEEKVLIEKRDEIISKQDQLFNILSIFGTQSQRGSLTIFDAFPERFNGFDIDIMNPHYPNYYQENEPPADWQNPNPIKFLTIPTGTKFNFYFLNPYGQLADDLKKALEILGIGAKTALGYGMFK